MRLRWLASFVVALALVGCKQQAGTTAPEGEAGTEAGTEAAAPAAAPEQAYLTAITGLRHEANEDKKVEVDGKKVFNWMMTLYRGEEVTVLKVDGDWAKARASDDSEGFVQKKYLLPTEGVQVATVFEEVKTFNRPDLLALGTRTLEVGDLLFVQKTKDQFSEVNRGPGSDVWVLSEKLVTDSNEVAAAKLLGKARWMDKKGDKEAAKVFDLARSTFGSTKLVTMMDEAAAQEPADDAAEPGSDDATAPDADEG